VLRYLVGADDKLANAPSAATPISIYDNLYVNATADGSFKLVIGFAAIDPNTNEKKYGFAQISKDSNGNFVTIVSESDPSDNSAVFSKTTNMINAGTQKGAVSLEGLANGIEGCSQAYIYSIDVVVGADKAFNMTLDFTPSGEANAGNSSPSTGETALPIAATVLLVASIGAVVVFKKKEN